MQTCTKVCCDVFDVRTRVVILCGHLTLPRDSKWYLGGDVNHICCISCIRGSNPKPDIVIYATNNGYTKYT